MFKCFWNDKQGIQPLGLKQISSVLVKIVLQQTDMREKKLF